MRPFPLILKGHSAHVSLCPSQIADLRKRFADQLLGPSNDRNLWEKSQRFYLDARSHGFSPSWGASPEVNR